jgi:serine/threonine protein kinase, bacterial
MALCHECGSDVAENDVFCPYCGISLKPIDMDDGDPAFESTIVMSPPEDPDRTAQSADSTAAQTHAEVPMETEAKRTNITDPHVSVGPTDQDITIPETSEEHVSESPKSDVGHQIDEVPVPSVLTELENKAGHLFQGINDRKPSISSPEFPQTDVTGSSLSSQDTSVEASPSTPEIKHDEEEEYVPSSFEGLPSIEAVHDPSVAARSESFPDHATEEPEEMGISKPFDIPVSEEPDPTPSMFDSVRIMEPSASGGNQAESSEPAGIGSSEGGTRQKSGPVSDARPQTASNIGMVDTDGRKAAKLKPLEEGTILNNRYEIVRKIGGGGMGAVYLASDNNLGGVLRAVKEMVQAHIEEEQQDKAIQDFKRESMILSTLDHPSIPTIYDYFFDDVESRFYLVMKYISGGDLSARLRSAPEGKLDEITVTEWAIQISDVLDYLHNQPTTIVYRDLKPSNIMIDGNTGRVMLIDFGIARSINQKEEKGVTAVGTMGYAPPELFSGNVEPRSDIYSLGSTMFHLLTGADPQSNPLLIFDFQKNPRPRQINPQLSDQIERFLMKSVEYNASSRYNSAAEVRHALEEHLDSLRKGNVTFGIKEIPASVSLANQSVFCGFCGQKIVATDLFCAFCGAKQPIAQQGVHSEIYTPAPLTAKLFVVGTNDLDSPTFQLEKTENLIGRRDPMSNIFPEVDLSKYDPQTKISRRHAKIWRDGPNYVLEDLASSNGTLILPASSDSRRLMPHQPYTLSNGDKIKLGDTTLHFMIG